MLKVGALQPTPFFLSALQVRFGVAVSTSLQGLCLEKTDRSWYFTSGEGVGA